MYIRGIHVIKLLFILSLIFYFTSPLLVLIFSYKVEVGGLSQEPTKVEGKHFFFSYMVDHYSLSLVPLF